MTEDHRQEEDGSALWGKLPRGPLIVLAIVGAVLIVVVGAWAFVRPTDPTEKKDFLQAVGVLLAGLVGLGGLYFTWRNLNQTRQTTQRTLELTERGQITERFTRAIDQLGATDDDGNKRMEIRLGGIYALERIARDSEQDHWPIMEVLTAYVRQHAPARPKEGQQGEEDEGVEKSEEDSGGSRQESEPTEVPAPAPDILAIMTVVPALPAPAPDIQAIMTVLGRRTRSFGHGEAEPLDLHHTNLTKANLSGADLSGADLSGADLPAANLTKANLSKANLLGALLLVADLSGALLLVADLSGAYLSGANLTKANLSGADLPAADLTGALLMEAYLTKANLSVANLSGAYLSGADLSGADLGEANLSGADLSGADLSGADLSGADLSGADLSGTQGLTQAQLDEIWSSENIKLPPDLKRPAYGGAETGEQAEEE